MLQTTVVTKWVLRIIVIICIVFHLNTLEAVFQWKRTYYCYISISLVFCVVLWVILVNVPIRAFKFFFILNINKVYVIICIIY